MPPRSAGSAVIPSPPPARTSAAANAAPANDVNRPDAWLPRMRRLLPAFAPTSDRSPGRATDPVIPAAAASGILQTM